MAVRVRDFAAAEGRTPVFVVENGRPLITEIVSKLDEDQAAQVVWSANPLECVATIQSLPTALVVAFGESSDEILQLLTLLKVLQKEVKAGRVRVVLITPIRQTSVLSKFSYLGVTELIPFPASGRAVHFKLQRHVRALAAAQEALARDARQGTRRDEERERLRKAKDGYSGRGYGAAVRLEAPLRVEGDFWLYPEDQRPKRIGGKWLIKLKGPAPNVGNWDHVAGTSEECWTWTPHRADDPDFGGLKGRWIFYGQKPDFEDDLWWFVSVHPQLTYEMEGEVKGTKLSLDAQGVLTVAADSAYGAAYKERIERSLARQVRSSKESDDKDYNREGLASKQGANLDDYGRGQRHEEGTESAETDYQIGPPLTLLSDCWLLEVPTVRHANRRWMVRLLGPGPSAGKWVPAEGAPVVEGVQAWEFAVDPAASGWVGAQDGGRWIFYGRQPQFQGDAWIFVSPQPLLGYLVGEDLHGTKIFWNEDDTLLLADDSTIAKSKLQRMRGSWKNLVADGDGKAKEDIRDLRGKDYDYSRTYEGRLLGDGEGSKLEGEFGGPKPLAEAAAPEPWDGRPKLSPLGLVFFCAELSARLGAESEKVAERWVGYLSAACGGVTVELWKREAGRDPKTVNLQIWVASHSARNEQRIRWVKSHASGFNLDRGGHQALIPVNSAEGKQLGAIVLSGPGVEAMNEPYLKALVWSVRGLLLVA